MLYHPPLYVVPPLSRLHHFSIGSRWKFLSHARLLLRQRQLFDFFRFSKAMGLIITAIKFYSRQNTESRGTSRRNKNCASSLSQLWPVLRLSMASQRERVKSELSVMMRNFGGATLSRVVSRETRCNAIWSTATRASVKNWFSPLKRS